MAFRDVKFSDVFKDNKIKIHCVKNVQIRSFFWSIISRFRICTLLTQWQLEKLLKAT